MNPQGRAGIVPGVLQQEDGRDERGRPCGAGYAAELVEEPARLVVLSGEIDALLERTGAPASARWASMQAGMAHERRMQPWCVVVRHGADMVGAALAVARRRLGAPAVYSAVHPHEAGWLAAADGAAAEALAAALAGALRELDRPWRLEWRHLPAADPTLAALRTQLPVALVLPGGEGARLAWDDAASIGDGLSRNTRSVVHRARKHIAAAGLTSELAWERDAAAIGGRMAAVVDVHQRRNRQLRGRAGLDDPNRRALFEATVRAHAAAGRARLLTLRLDGDLAAFAICFESSGVLHVYANMASPDWLSFSPGTLANAEVVWAATRDPGLHAVDWGLGLQRYKLSGPHVQVAQCVHLWAWSSLAGRVAWAVGHRLAGR